MSRSRPGWLLLLLDLLAIVLVLVAATVYATGGFREWAPWGLISVRSWTRPLIVALLAIVLRHALQPRPTLLARVAGWWRQAAAAPGVRVVVPLVISTRLFVLIVGFLAVTLFGFRQDVGIPWRFYDNEFLNLPARWDTGWYVGIALEGYQWSPSRQMQQQNIAFFPLYPMLMRYGSLLFGRELLWTGVAISWVAFVGALVYLFRFARERVGEDAAAAGLTLLACYPFALFFSTAYTEALFLLTAAGAFYHFEKNQLWRAGAWGLLAGLSRPNGCLLSVALAFIAIRPLWPLRGMRVSDWLSVADRLAVAAMPGIGMLLYSTFVFSLTGHPLQWAAQNAAWGRVYRGVDTLVEQHAATIGEHGLYTYAATQTLDVLQLAAVILALVAIVPVLRRFGVPYAVWLAVNIVPPLLMGGLLSMGRVTSVLFPMFLWLGAAIRPTHRPAWIIAFAMLQAICAALFFTWRPLF